MTSLSLLAVCKIVYLYFFSWYQENTKVYSVDEMARALIDSEVFVAFVSGDYVKDEDCTNIFKYARLTLRKPMVVVAVGDGFEWKQSKLGILLSDEVQEKFGHFYFLSIMYHRF